MKQVYVMSSVLGLLLSSTAFGGSHASGVQVGKVTELNANVENVNDGFPFSGEIARVRYEYRDEKTLLLGGAFLQHVRAENRNSVDGYDKESLVSTGGGLHVGLLIGGAGSFDVGFGFQPARFERVSGSDEGQVKYKHSYKSGFNVNAGLTLIPSYGKLGIPIRFQVDMTSLSKGRATNESGALLRNVSMFSNSFLAGLDILY